MGRGRLDRLAEQRATLNASLQTVADSQKVLWLPCHLRGRSDVFCRSVSSPACYRAPGAPPSLVPRPTLCPQLTTLPAPPPPHRPGRPYSSGQSSVTSGGRQGERPGVHTPAPPEEGVPGQHRGSPQTEWDRLTSHEENEGRTPRPPSRTLSKEWVRRKARDASNTRNVMGVGGA
ncbi:hypothetical protein GWK47_015878 [Chionoecetes opilio]|uniref:Uncharacterized protein n=1 Tax=Chionoecetes opilio TaxID=41210 RepID=A0A8J4XV00_CHIOP|nr:hypothetical protein GWK47_015878 [Chionoecetes opilio]